MTIPVDDDGSLLTRDDKRLIREAATSTFGDGSLRVRRVLTEGASGARVYDAAWICNERVCDHLVIKLDRVWRLRNESSVMDSFGKRAPSFMPIVAKSFDDDTRPDADACLIYAHVGAAFMGPMISQKEAFAKAWARDDAAVDHELDRVGRIVGIIESQLRQPDHEPVSGQVELEFYVRRWYPSAEIRCARASETADGGLVLRLNDGDDGTPLEVGSDEDADAAHLGRSVAFRADALYCSDSAIVANIDHEATIAITGVTVAGLPPSWRAVRGERRAPIKIYGELLATRRGRYQALLSETGLDGSRDTIEVAGLSVPSPIRHLWERARRWARRDPSPTIAFGHGDLHAGNVLLVGDQITIIDHALAGPKQPSAADAARLIGSLWRDVVVPSLSDADLATATAALLNPSLAGATREGGRAARFLEAAVEKALATGLHTPGRARDLWVALHHFAFIGLKWPGSRSQLLAMVLLAAVAAERADTAARELVLALQLRRLVPDRAGSRELVVHLPAYLEAASSIARAIDPSPSQEIRRRLLEEILTFTVNEAAALAATPDARDDTLERLLDKALVGAFGTADVQFAEGVRADVTGSYTPRDRVLLADILFFALMVVWRADAFQLLLDLATCGEQPVEDEAALVLGWLLSSETIRAGVVAAEPLRRRAEALLQRPDVAHRLVLGNMVRVRGRGGRVQSGVMDRAFAAELQIHRLDWLRPFEPDAAFRGAAAALGQPRLPELLQKNWILTEVEKTHIARSAPRLTMAQAAHMVLLCEHEQQAWRGFDRLQGSYHHRLDSLGSFAMSVFGGAHQTALRERLASVQSGLAELVSAAGQHLLLRARELAWEALRDDDRATGQRLDAAHSAVEHFERAAMAGELPVDACIEWAEVLSLLAEGGADERALRRRAAEIYRRVVELKPDMDEALHNWGDELGELARLSDDREQERQLRGQAVDCYRRAVEVKPDMHGTLYSWGVQLGGLARLSEDRENERQLRRQAIECYRRAVEVKPDMHEALNNWATQSLCLSHDTRIGTDERATLLAEARSRLVEMARILGTPVTSLYNYACVLAQEMRHEEALSSLDICLHQGEVTAIHVREDPDWAHWLGDEELQALLARSEAQA